MRDSGGAEWQRKNREGKQEREWSRGVCQFQGRRREDMQDRNIRRGEENWENVGGEEMGQKMKKEVKRWKAEKGRGREYVVSLWLLCDVKSNKSIESSRLSVALRQRVNA